MGVLDQLINIIIVDHILTFPVKLKWFFVLLKLSAGILTQS